MNNTIANEFQARVNRLITRGGISDLMQWIGNSDFYTAPASTRYHGTYEGGLVEHSVAVHDRLIELCNWYEIKSSEESIAIVALFHDLCKIGTYKTEKRWRKDKNQQWEQYDTYAKHEDFAFGGHGSKSMYLVMHFMQLTPEEAVAINCHMGQWDSSAYSNPSEAYEQHKLAWLLHVADEAATYIDSK